MKRNMVAWFEIPVSNMERAKNFYEKVFDISISIHDMGGIQMGWFPDAGEVSGASGSLVKNESYIPSKEGALLYFNSDDITTELDRVHAAGGTVYQEKTLISEEHGHMGVFIDSEGNRIALYARS